MHTLEQIEILRYQRHFPVIGIDGQQRLKEARVLCVGAGGLGCPALQYLAAAGIGTLGVMDADNIELSNLQRQVLFHEEDIGQNKAMIIAKQLRALNHHISVHAYSEFLSKENAHGRIQDYDLVLDATDNYEARYLLNQVCRSLKKPLISASIYQFDAQVSVFNYKNGPCYQCLYPSPPPATLTPNCAIGGVIGVLPGVVGAIQATEAIKVILNLGEILSGTLLSMDLLSWRFKQFEIVKQNCDHHPLVTFDINSTANEAPEFLTINALELSALLKEDEHGVQLIDVRQLYERDICHIGGEHIPLPVFEANIAQLPKDKPLVIYCKSGARSTTACKMLYKAGFKEVRHLEGGILSWINTIDDRLMRY